MKMNSLVTPCLGALAGLALGSSATLWAAPRASSKAEVRSPEQLCTRSAASGTARITPLAQGEKAFVGMLELNPGAQVKEHRDPTEEYIHVLQGHGEIVIDGVKHRVSPGTTVYMPAKARVSYSNGSSTMVALQVFAGPEPANKYKQWQGCQ